MTLPQVDQTPTATDDTIAHYADKADIMRAHVTGQPHPSALRHLVDTHPQPRRTHRLHRLQGRARTGQVQGPGTQETQLGDAPSMGERNVRNRNAD